MGRTLSRQDGKAERWRKARRFKGGLLLTRRGEAKLFKLKHLKRQVKQHTSERGEDLTAGEVAGLK